MVARHFCNESILRDCEKTPVSFFDAIRMLYVSFDAIRMLYALCNMYVSFDAIRMLYALCDTPVSCFMRKVCSMRRAWLWGIYRMFCFCEELSKSIIYWLDQLTDIDYPTICFALIYRIYYLIFQSPFTCYLVSTPQGRLR